MDLLQKNKAKISDLISQTFDLIQARYSTSDQLFTVASVWGQIIFVLDNLSQFILYFIEDSITELNINTATREASVYGLATLAGHDPTRAISAKGECIIKWNGKNLDQVRGGAILFPNFAELNCVNNGKKYFLNIGQDYIRINLEEGEPLYLSFTEGTKKTVRFSGQGTLLQSFNISARGTSSIEQFAVDVKRNGEPWKRYDSLYDIPRNGKGFITRSS